MSDSTRRPGAGTPDDGHETDSDYQLREVEARLDRRLAAMEARYARTRGLAMVAGLGMLLSLAALGWTVAGGGASGDVHVLPRVATQEVILQDADGVQRGRLATDSIGRAVLSLSDRDGRQRIRLTVLEDGSPGVTIHDPESRPRAVLGYLPDGTTNLVFTDRSGDIRTLVGVGPNGSPSMSMFGEDSERTAADEPDDDETDDEAT